MADGKDLPLDEQDTTGLSSPKQKHKRWLDEITFYESKFAQDWHERGRKILKRYKDERSPREQKVPRFNILWSNIETMKPALYARKPKPDIDRRFRDKDPVGRVTSMILERAISFYMNDQFNLAIKNAVLDRLLPGRGLVWTRYEPHFRDNDIDGTEEEKDFGVEVTDNVDDSGGGEDDDDQKGAADSGEAKSDKVLDRETLQWDYVHWQDFGHCFGRTWDEIPACWRKVYLSRTELVDRFGEEIGGKVVLDYSPHDLKDAKISEIVKKATVYEIWDKESRTAAWFHKDYEEGLLDEVDDPLELEDFFPFPMPMFSTLANDNLIPTPDYIEYQDQANELDNITSRIAAITKAIKVVGVYDASAEGVQRILAEGVENQLVPISQYAVFSEKGGFKGAYELMDMQMILQTLLGLYQARDKVKADLYEITGIADIVRGASDPQETATAQRIKGKFGTLRLQDKQDDVQRFVRSLVKVGTEIIAKHFMLDTLKEISGVHLLMAEEKAMLAPWYRAFQSSTQQMANNASGGAQAPQPHSAAPAPGVGNAPSQASTNPQLSNQAATGAPPSMQSQAQQQAPAGQPPMPQPGVPPLQALLPPQFAGLDEEDLAELMDDPTWEEVYQLLHTEPMLAYKIDIETDSTIALDKDDERKARIDFLTAVGGFLQSATQVQNPDLAPLMAKLLEFGVRSFSVGKELESAFDVAINKLEKDADNPTKQPSPEVMKIQGELALQKATADREDQRVALQAQTDNQQAAAQRQFDMAKLQSDASLEMQKAKLDSETKIIVAQIQAKQAMKQTQITTGLDAAKVHDPAWAGAPMGDGAGPEPSIAGLIQTVVQQMQTTLNGMQQSHQQMAQAMMRPRQVVRDGAGNITGLQ